MEDRNLCRNPLCLRKSNYIILLFVIPLIYILTVEKKQWFSYQNLIGDYQTLDVDGSVTVNISENYHGINLMDVPINRFDPNYKNPCWRERGKLRCLPYFFIAGVMKSGTSELWKYVSSHPDFARPGFAKESQWFSKGRFKPGKESFDYFINLFRPVALRMETASKERQRRLITGEASPSNLYKNCHWRYLPGNENMDEPKYVILDYIHHVQPQAKILVIFRDPVDRLYSEYYHRYGQNRKKYNPSPEHFHGLVVEGLRLYKECLESRTIRACVYDERIYIPLNIHIQLGMYHVYWEELTRVFPREHILYLHNKDLRDIDSFMRPVFHFLDLIPVPFKEKMKQKHANAKAPVDTSRGEMLNTTRKLLVDFYRPYNVKMYRLMRDPAFLYHLSL